MPEISWNSYHVGELRNKILSEMKAIAAGKEYRKKKGLESAPYKDTKGNEHWVLYANLEIMELFTKRLDEVMKATYTSSTQLLLGNREGLKQLNSQIKSAERSLKESNSKSTDVLKKYNSQTLSKLKDARSHLKKMDEALETHVKSIRSDTLKASKAMVQALNTEINKIKIQLDSQHNDISAQFAANKATLDSMKQDMVFMNQELEESRGILSKQMAEQTEDIVGKLVGISEEGETLTDKLEGQQSTIMNVMADHQTALVSEVQQTAGTLTQQNTEIFEKQAEATAGQTEQISNIVSELDKKIDYMQTNFTTKLDDQQSDYKKILEREVTELRTSLSNIRGDIELMKALLTRSQ